MERLYCVCKRSSRHFPDALAGRSWKFGAVFSHLFSPVSCPLRLFIYRARIVKTEWEATIDPARGATATPRAPRPGGIAVLDVFQACHWKKCGRWNSGRARRQIIVILLFIPLFIRLIPFKELIVIWTGRISGH